MSPHALFIVTQAAVSEETAMSVMCSQSTEHTKKLLAKQANLMFHPSMESERDTKRLPQGLE